MSDYRQSAVSGERWKRCLHIECNNAFGGQPSIRFDEEQRLVLGDGTTIGTPAGSIHKVLTDPSATFPMLDPTTGNPVGAISLGEVYDELGNLYVTLTHGQVYAILWSLYMALAAERDQIAE